MTSQAGRARYAGGMRWTIWLAAIGASACRATAPDAKAVDSEVGVAPAPAAVKFDDGRELVGTPAKPWRFVDWSHSEPLALDQLRGRVVVVRFWTNGCPFCERTLPAIQRLASEFPANDVVFVAAFHAKPKGTGYDAPAMVKLAEGMGVTFPIAFDPRWQTLDDWYMTGFRRRATSVTFVIGRDGKIAHIHPGPMFFPSDDPASAKENADFTAVRDAIRRALAS